MSPMARRTWVEDPYLKRILEKLLSSKCPSFMLIYFFHPCYIPFLIISSLIHEPIWGYPYPIPNYLIHSFFILSCAHTNSFFLYLSSLSTRFISFENISLTLYFLILLLLFTPKIFLKNFICQTSILLSSFEFNAQVSHPYILISLISGTCIQSNRFIFILPNKFIFFLKLLNSFSPSTTLWSISSLSLS